jgi:hypothetical protein
MYPSGMALERAKHLAKMLDEKKYPGPRQNRLSGHDIELTWGYHGQSNRVTITISEHGATPYRLIIRKPDLTEVIARIPKAVQLIDILDAFNDKTFPPSED